MFVGNLASAVYADGVGFEPTEPVVRTGFYRSKIGRFKPLSHPSKASLAPPGEADAFVAGIMAANNNNSVRSIPGSLLRALLLTVTAEHSR
jgi:hypothetical protein